MLGFAYEIPENFQTYFYKTKTYEKIRSTRNVVVNHVRQTGTRHKTSVKGEFVLYVAINLVNNKLYVGITRNGLENRKAEHFYSADHGSPGLFHKAIRKYGKDAFEFVIYSKIYFGGYAKLLFFERQLISAIMPEYNLTAGGQGNLGYKPTQETLQKQSDSHKGKVGSWKGKKRSPESIAKMVATRKSNGVEQNKGKLVICLTDGKIYRSIKDAANFYQIEIGHLGQVLKGKFKTNFVRDHAFEFVRK